MLTSTKELSAVVKQLALETGFDQVGITRPEFVKEAETHLQKWIQEGRHGEMKYLEDYELRRERFLRDFPDAKSILVLGVNYFSKSEQDESDGRHQNGIEWVPRGLVARYARGRDYHLVIRHKHEILQAKLQKVLGREVRVESCIDTKPIPERHAALKAGLGFFGKNTMLLSQKFGPWLFLSEMVTNLELEEDRAAEGDCGTCTHCQRVCPTGALDEDYRIDARLCIAYLTIEHKGVIPRALRPKIKDWVFGCDECLTICPFTSKQKESQNRELSPTAGVGARLDFDALFSLRSNRAYQKKYAGTALLRANRKQMLRNACIVLGNSGRAEAIPYLQRALQDKASLVRLHAAWGLGRLNFPEAQAVLKNRLSQESDPAVIQEIQEALF